MYIPVKVPEKMHVDVYLPVEISGDSEVDMKEAHRFTRSESGRYNTSTFFLN